jgi:hypothetical protein
MNLQHATERALTTVAMLMISSMIHAAPIDVGGVTLEIPNPVGYTAITSKMTAIFDIQTKSWPKSAVHYFTFLQDSEIPIALRGEIPEMNRRFAVTALTDTVNVTVRKSDFERMRQAVRTQHEQLTQTAMKSVPGELENFSKRISEQGGSINLDMPQSVPYAPHEDSERSLASSAINRYTTTGIDGNTTSVKVAMTHTFLHVRGKLLQLDVYGEEDALAWTREVSKQWSDAILTANPPDERSIAAEAASGQRQGIDWIRVVLFSLLAYLIGGAGGFVWHKFFKKKTVD